jgi:glycosyltransferase involved in cell wall biosynthesis
MSTEQATVVSVIVPVLDDADRLDRCLSALDAQSISRGLEILVVDNGSQHPPVDVVARHPRARLLTELKPGSYAARNAGVAQARGRVLAFTDSDCTPAPTWLERAVAAIDAEAEPAFLAGRVEVVPADGGAPTWIEEWEMIHGFPQKRYVEQLRFGVTANLVVAADHFATVGGFNADLKSSGDREWGQRATERGMRAVYRDDLVVLHPARRTLGEVRTKVRRVSRGAVRLAAAEGTFPLGGDFGKLVLRPPVRTIARTARALGGRRGARYVAAAAVVHGMYVVERIAAFLTLRRGRL